MARGTLKRFPARRGAISVPFTRSRPGSLDDNGSQPGNLTRLQSLFAGEVDEAAHRIGGQEDRRELVARVKPLPAAHEPALDTLARPEPGGFLAHPGDGRTEAGPDAVLQAPRGGTLALRALLLCRV